MWFSAFAEINSLKLRREMKGIPHKSSNSWCIYKTTKSMFHLDLNLTVDESGSFVMGWRQLFSANVGIDWKAFRFAWSCSNDLYRNASHWWWVLSLIALSSFIYCIYSPHYVHTWALYSVYSYHLRLWVNQLWFCGTNFIQCRINKIKGKGVFIPSGHRTHVELRIYPLIFTLTYSQTLPPLIHGNYKRLLWSANSEVYRGQSTISVSYRHIL